MGAKGSILKSIKTVFKKTKDCELKPSIFKKLKPELSFLSKQLKLTQKQSFFFSIIFGKSVSNSYVDRNDIRKYLNCDSVDFMEYHLDILRLFDKGYLYKVRSRSQQSLMKESFKVNSNIQQAILKKKDLNTALDLKISNAVEFVDYIFSLMKQVIDDKLDISEALKSTQASLKKYKYFEFIKTLNKFNLSTEDVCILLYYIGLYRIGDKNYSIKSLSIDMYGETGTSSDLIQNMAAGNHVLVKKNFLRYAKSNGNGLDEFDFELTGETKNLMRKHKIIPEFETKICADTFDFLYTIETLYIQKKNEVITAKELLSQVENLLQSNEDLQIVKEIKHIHLQDLKYKAIYLKTLYDGGVGNETAIEKITESIYDNGKEAVLLRKEIVQESNELIIKDLLELTKASLFSNAKLRLTDISQQLLVSCGMELPNKQKNNYSIFPDAIKSKPLYYNDEDASQMSMLRQILEEDNFSDIQKRMSKKALPIGVIALLYGPPGTGKTESV